MKGYRTYSLCEYDESVFLSFFGVDGYDVILGNLIVIMELAINHPQSKCSLSVLTTWAILWLLLL